MPDILITALKHQSIPVMLVDLEKRRTVFVNDAARKIVHEDVDTLRPDALLSFADGHLQCWANTANPVSEFVTYLTRQDGSHRLVSVTMTEAGEHHLLTFVNETTRIIDSRRLIEEQRRNDFLLQTAGGLIARIDYGVRPIPSWTEDMLLHAVMTEGHVGFANSHFYDAFDLDPGNSGVGLLIPKAPDLVAGLIQNIAGSGRVSKFECEIHTQDRVKTIQITAASQMEGTRVSRTWIYGHDVTDLRELEQALMNTSRAEQRRISQDLHDGLGQHMTDVILALDSLELQTQSAKMRQQIVQVSDRVRAISDMVRDISRSLSPFDLATDTSLYDALAALKASSDTLSANEIVLELGEPSPELSREGRWHLYSIIAEAVNNAYRHGNADTVHIRSYRDDGAFVIEVTDNGSGFDHGTVDAGVGLSSMEARSRALSGTFEVHSSDAGTVIRLTIPEEHTDSTATA